MDFFDRFRHQLANRIVLIFLVQSGIVVGLGWILYHLVATTWPHVFWAGLACIYVTSLLFAGAFVVRDSTEPVRMIWNLVQFISPDGEQRAAPRVEEAKIGRDMLITLSKHIYQLTSVVSDIEQTKAIQQNDIHANFVANSLPLPFIVISKDNVIMYANEAANRYFATTEADIAGQDINTLLPMSFSDSNTLDAWLADVRKHKATADKQWERVRIGLPGQKDSRQFDLAAHYNRSNPMQYETLLVLFDHTDIYSQDDQAMSFVALTVHELRTPLTLLRGYIEVFDEEIGPTLSPDLKTFMAKMNASIQQLTSFVNNILNVAKIEDNQLTLQLHKADWADIIESAVTDLYVRANVRGIHLKTTLDPDLPPVAVDRYSIYEVLANLIDNAIKYAGTTKEVHITAGVNADGLVETSIKDFGLGIDSNILPHIFDKFYRNHRNRAQVGGTGLGLYLSRAIIQAHGGHISVVSKVDEGSTFTFTLLPFSALNKTMTDSDGSIVRGAHGWIRNHSLYRE